MAEKRRNSKKKEQINLPLLLTVLAVCVVVIVVIAVMTGKEGEGKDTDKEPVSDLVDNSTVSNTKDSGDADTSDTKKDPDSDDATVGTVTDDTSETEANDSETEDSDESSGFEYTVGTETETKKTDNGQISIIYPTIIDPDGESDRAELLNDMIKAYMDQMFKYDGVSSAGGEYTYEITDTITAVSTDDFASIIVKGQYYIEDTPNPTVFTYTINCDVKSTDIVPSSELIYDFSKIKEMFLDGKFKLKEGNSDLLDETNYEDMIMEYRSEYGIYPNVYFTEDSFGMVIDLVYTLGGYAMFEIPYSYVTDYVFCPCE